ncbi:MAG: TetR/AcrR family transcriptional regulator [Paludibacterium sp.]|uniref:TetR/AcrR family transcriptional regulator n=1 Tax=Paludibacterium sp. TaxID=1917523 RepID=UPI0025CFD0F3|nr:TetR/AcrR family transcriptional regulator [Paludibacterium sp.]MBV8046711.1 TetR/AcrR family transcriptional regulator [Paludibacterium sp.]MBV8646802.1 TetR/AcrR family transcriptional regulator [Paludibacterium sp.]
MLKSPKQQRAKLTVRLIFESTAQIILREGIDRLTTNRIAEVAGFSVGTLYQYFRNKEAILLAMVSHEKDLMIAELDALFARTEGQTLSERVTALVDFLMQTFYQRRAIRRTIARAIFSQQPLPSLYSVIAAVENHLAALFMASQTDGMRPLTPVAAYVASRGLIGTLRAGILEQSPWAGTEALRAELRRMMMAILSAD